MDTGVDTNHPDFVNNMVPGYDFYDNDDQPDPMLDHPDSTHGTECSGLIAVQGDNSIDVTGVAWNGKIMPVRISATSTADSFIADSERATSLRWAAMNGADVISNSWYILWLEGMLMPELHRIWF